MKKNTNAKMKNVVQEDDIADGAIEESSSRKSSKRKKTLQYHGDQEESVRYEHACPRKRVRTAVDGGGRAETSEGLPDGVTRGELLVVNAIDRLTDVIASHLAEKGGKKEDDGREARVIKNKKSSTSKSKKVRVDEPANEHVGNEKKIEQRVVQVRFFHGGHGKPEGPKESHSDAKKSDAATKKSVGDKTSSKRVKKARSFQGERGECSKSKNSEGSKAQCDLAAEKKTDAGDAAEKNADNRDENKTSECSMLKKPKGPKAQCDSPEKKTDGGDAAEKSAGEGN